MLYNTAIRVSLLCIGTTLMLSPHVSTPCQCRKNIEDRNCVDESTDPRVVGCNEAAISSRHAAAQVGQVSTPTANVAQALQKTTEANKIDDVVLLLYEEMQQADTNGHRMPLTIVFVERKLRADQVAEALRAETISAAALHGGLSQVPLSCFTANLTGSDRLYRAHAMPSCPTTLPARSWHTPEQ